MADELVPEPDASRSIVVRRITLGTHHRRTVTHDPRPWAEPLEAASAVIVQRPAGARLPPFMLMYFSADDQWVSTQYVDALVDALEAGFDVAGIDADEWEVVAEAFWRVPVISDEMLMQLEFVTPSTDRWLQYRPCRVRLRDGNWREHVYVQEQEDFFDAWGVRPGSGDEREVPFADVVEITESLRRLPPTIANALYESGESAMGGCYFTLITSTRRRIPCQTGNAVDFVDLPSDIDPADIIGVEPHADDARRARQAMHGTNWAWSTYLPPD